MNDQTGPEYVLVDITTTADSPSGKRRLRLCRRDTVVDLPACAKGHGLLPETGTAARDRNKIVRLVKWTAAGGKVQT